MTGQLALGVLLCLAGGPDRAGDGGRPGEKEAPRRPNILWVTCEDMSSNLGCYGDREAVTPAIDRLASQGVRYTHAFSVAGVCAPSRSCLITGMYPSSLGSHYMRCRAALPPEVKCFTEHLRAAGYYCSNNVKTDYNFPVPKGAWDASSAKAHWRGRKAGQPFFSVFNFVTTHESQIRAPEAQFRKQTARLAGGQRHDPDRVAVPPFHPDTPLTRRDWARDFDLITAMDRQVADVLAQLEADGLSDDTVVFFYSDHGVGLPRGKRWLYDTGLRVPLVLRFGKNVAGLAPGKPGSVSSRLVSFVDFGPTALSLAGVPVPGTMQGVPFLGKAAGEPRKYVFGIRDRMDERNDCTRAVRDGRHKYIRNYQPWKPWAQVLEYMEFMPTMQEYRRLAAAGKLSPEAALWMAPTKPAEELYDTEADPHELKNLAADPAHAATLARLRAAHEGWQRDTLDLGLMPEALVHARSKGSTPHQMARDATLFPRERLREAALACAAGRRDDLARHLKDGDEGVRWWAVTGLAGLGVTELPALRGAAADPSPLVRVAAADGLRRVGKPAEALPVLEKALGDGNPWVRHEAALALDGLGEGARPALARLRAALADENEYVVRVARHTLKALKAEAPGEGAGK